MRFFVLLFVFVVLSAKLSAQIKVVPGVVIDKESKQRLAKVYIYNSQSDEGVINNTKGEFNINAKVGDVLVAALAGYGVDTVIYKGQSAIYFQLKSIGIRLRDVSIKSKMISPQQQYQNKLQEYNYALVKGSSKDLLNLSNGGVGLGIDAIYSLLSKQGKNARHLQEILERDYREALIDYRFNPTLVEKTLGISNYELVDFMQQYRPSYQFVLSANEYAFALFIRNAYQTYKRNPKAYRLEPLPQLKIDKL